MKNLVNTVIVKPLETVGNALSKITPQNIYHQGIRLIALAPYAIYYGGYKMNKWAAKHWYTAPLRPLGWAMQTAIVNDMMFDWLKSKTGFHETVWDEGKHGSINPFHKDNDHRGPYLPGARINSRGKKRIEWAW